MDLTEQERKDAEAIMDDLDLSNLARDYTQMSNVRAYPMADVLSTLHATYPGGISQFYNEKKF